ncbi:MAG: ribosomal protein S18-alanine N-acetyltransferase [Tissierellia bacterium]|nr:ribosomal protein S18-alanine N-acetyltransferase [Tissierellia bacterium]
MDEMIKTRQASLEDLDRIMEIEETSFRSPWPRRNMELELKNRVLAHYHVLSLYDLVIAYAGGYILDDQVHISNVAVDIDYRNNGYGRRLMEAFLEACHKKGVQEATLEVREDNLPALALYESLGFVQKGLRKNYYQDLKKDALILWKTWEEERDDHPSL